MNELIGQFPADWELLKLPEVLFFQEGPGITSDKFTKEGIPFINIRCFVNGRIDRGSCQFISQKLGNGEYRHFQLAVNDWVFSSSGTIGKIAFIFDEDLPLLLNTSTIRFRTKDEKRLANNYIKFFLESFHFKIQHQLQTQGSAQVNVGPTHLQKMHIPLPPIKEQAKIAEVLSTVDKAISETEALIAKQQRIKTGLMQDLLTRGIDENGNLRSEETHQFKDSPLGRIPIEWETISMEKITTKIVDGIHHKPNYVQQGIPFIVVTDLTSSEGINFNPSRFITEKDHQEFYKRADPKPKDVLVTKDGTLGIARIVPDEAPDFSIFVSVAMLRPNSSKCIPELIWSFFESGRFLTQLGSLSAGTGLAHIHLEHFRRFQIHWMPVDEQKKIFDVLNKQHFLLQKQCQDLEKLKQLKTGLMQDLLTGKKRVTPLLENSPIS